MITAAQKIQNGIIQLMDEHCAFGMVLYGLEVIEADIPTMGTDGHQLLYGREFVERLPIRQLLFVLCHEAMHVLGGHPWRFRDILAGEAKINQKPAQALLNVAADYTVNLTLSDIDDFYDAPKDVLLDQQYRTSKGLPENVETIYRKLRQNVDEKPLGSCGECMSAPDDSDQAEAEARIAEIIAVAKARGDLPASMTESIDDFLDAPTSWINQLLSLATSVRKSDYSMRRPNNRYLQTGLYLPILQSPGIGTVVFGIDTSGSVSTDELRMYGGQIRDVIDSLNPSEAKVMYCDAKVHGVDSLAAGEAFTKMTVTGRGGTSFKPVFDEVHKRGIEPDVLIYLTDLESDFPSQPHYPVIWVSSRPGHTAPWGAVVEIC